MYNDYITIVEVGAMSTTMHRLQISVPEWQYRYLQERAEHLSDSIAGVIRMLVEKDAQASRRPIEEDPFWGIIGMVEGDDPDAGVEHDRYIYGLGKGGQSGGSAHAANSG
jgi:hypothetical protein